MNNRLGNLGWTLIRADLLEAFGNCKHFSNALWFLKCLRVTANHFHSQKYLQDWVFNYLTCSVRAGILFSDWSCWKYSHEFQWDVDLAWVTVTAWNYIQIQKMQSALTQNLPKLKANAQLRWKKTWPANCLWDPQANVVLAMDVSFPETEEHFILGFFLLRIPNRICWKLFKGLGFGNKPRGRWISRQWVGEKVKKTTYCIVLCTLTFSAVHLRIYLLYSSVFYIYMHFCFGKTLLLCDYTHLLSISVYGLL